MTSGIYKLTFKSGDYYIGKSLDITTRWKQHADSMSKGKAAKAMQNAFNKYGYPVCAILFEAHKDHLEMLEAYLINYAYARNKQMLNTTIPECVTDTQFKSLEEAEPFLKYPTHELLKHITELRKELIRVSPSSLQ